jgi:acetolactate synthase-1/2/3 large subunit
MTHSSNGAHSVVQTLVDGGIDVCFANPGTSEMHFMAALDLEPRIRGVLGLFEGVVTGAADGFARMADRPAATLLHLGPGLANGAANIHNARRAGSAMVNIVGDHATYHKRHDAPLTSDVEGIAAPFSDWVRTAESACTVGLDTAAAIQAASGKPGRIATLVLPADTAWNAGPGAGTLLPPRVAPRAGADAVVAAARILRSGEPTAILMTGQVLRSGPLTTASRIAQATGAQLVAQTSNGRVERGQGRVAVQRLPYAVDAALAFLKPYRNLILVGAKAPVAFFAYPDKPSVLTAAGCRVFTLTAPDQDGTEALADLAAELNCTALAPLFLQRQPEIQGSDDGPLNSASIARVVAQSMPENAIVADESVTTGRDFFRLTQAAAPHDWLQVTGGAIGCGIPLACGAAIACPDRKVINLEADGSAMYTVQGLWTQARENLDVVTVILNNRAYATLALELVNVGIPTPGPRALDMIQLQRPQLDWQAAARTFGIPASRVETVAQFRRALDAAVRACGPVLIEVMC